ncbi:hypothetical protein FisN_20Lu045 [Fistulifera solaris]|uniref:Uncharacterized protein n=1 Tax=Fistulifera solaris TaxID=1519565 RepID=A0A1Z5JW69_FISSO|nr:hypothetical protein FisN_20Lu045 [Fistulifera solaris]|eukprot:GAX18274.1 hypothetical protein FisN_20Lu045 [Fistulifera solaris]
MIHPNRPSIGCNQVASAVSDSLADALQYHVLRRSAATAHSDRTPNRSMRTKRVMKILQEALELIDSIEIDSNQCIDNKDSPGPSNTARP